MSDDPRREPVIVTVDDEGNIVADLSGVGFVNVDSVGFVNVDSVPTMISSTSASTHGPTPHEALSRVVYDIAKLVEKVNMGAPEGQVDADTTVGDVMEEIMTMIVTAPLSQEYATRLAFEKG